MAITHLMLFVGETELGTMVLGVTKLTWLQYGISWGLALLSLPLFILTQAKVPMAPFQNLLEAFDLESASPPGASTMEGARQLLRSR